MDEVERLAEMERQRRQKEAEQKVRSVIGVLISCRTYKMHLGAVYIRSYLSLHIFHPDTD